MKTLRLLLLLVLMVGSSAVPTTASPGNAPVPARKTDAANAREARQLFDRIYNMVFGPEGSSLTYSVNIIGVYKTQGNIVYKGKKLHYMEKRYAAWEDGTTAYMVDKKKRQVGIYRVDDDKKDAYLSKFKYDINNFDFSYKVKGEYYEVTAWVRNASFFGIRHVTALVRRSNLYPVSLRIKLSIFSTEVQITDFKPGGISDKAFTFPRSRYADYKFVDHREKN